MGGKPPKPPKPSLRSAVKATPLRGALRAALTAAALRLIGRQGQTECSVWPLAKRIPKIGSVRFPAMLLFTRLKT